MKIFKLAQHFQLKYAKPKYSILDYEYLKNAAMEDMEEAPETERTLRSDEIDSGMKKILEGIKDISEINRYKDKLKSLVALAIASKEDGFKPNEDQEKVLNLGFYIKSVERVTSEEVENAISGNIAFETLVAKFKNLLSLINDIKETKGMDKVKRQILGYYSIVSIYDDIMTSDRDYGEFGKLDERNRNDLVYKPFIQICKYLHSLGVHLNKIMVGFEQLLEQGGLQEHIDVKVLKKPMMNHEKERFVELFDEKLGLDGVNKLNEWNEFIESSDEMKELARSIWQNPKFKPMWRHSAKAMLDNIIASAPSIISKLEVLKNHIAILKDEKTKKENAKTERHFGTPPPISIIVPEKNVREIIRGFDAEERALWNEVPHEIKSLIQHGKIIDLDEVLRRVQDGEIEFDDLEIK